MKCTSSENVFENKYSLAFFNTVFPLFYIPVMCGEAELYAIMIYLQFHAYNLLINIFG